MDRKSILRKACQLILTASHETINMRKEKSGSEAAPYLQQEPASKGTEKRVIRPSISCFSYSSNI
jgi:hypothetical protein